MSKTDDYWSYWDFALPVRLGSKKMFSKRIVVFLFFQIATAFLFWIIMIGFFEINVNETYGAGLFGSGRPPAALGNLLALAGYLVIAWIFWNIYDKKYQRQK